MVQWPFGGRQPHRGAAPAEMPVSLPTSSRDLADPELLDLLRWHIDRYDRIRASTSSRASILLSANSLLLTGVVLLANYLLQGRGDHGLTYVDIVPIVVSVVTVGLIFVSVLNCINAVAARKTVRALHEGEIPSRFLFNWGDTLRAVDGYSSFASMVTSAGCEAIIGHAIAELWTDIMQHKQRHGYLRAGISVFRYCVGSFTVLAAVALIFRLGG